jgi:hypothetical protein
MKFRKPYFASERGRERLSKGKEGNKGTSTGKSSSIDRQ